jgi:PAS domain S-box-containing protein
MNTTTPEVVILAVDDKKQNLFALEMTLRKVPARVVQATSGEEALSLTLQHDFALAILDVQMPEMDGYELAELLLGDPATSRIPIIFVTAAYSDEQHLFKGYKSGAVDYIMKPFDPEVLLGKVRVFLELARYRLGLESLVAQRTAALQASEIKYRTLIENAYDIIQHTRPDGAFEFVSPSWRRVLGYSEAEVRSLSLWSILAPEAQAHCQRTLKEVLEGRPALNTKTAFLAKDGRKVYVEGNIIPDVVDGKVVGVQSFYRDITAREEAETRLELAIKGSGVGLWDLRTPFDQMVVTGGWADVEGLPATGSLVVDTAAWAGVIHPEDRGRAEEAFRRHFRGETDHYESEVRMRLADGGWAWVLDRGKVLEWDDRGKPTRAAGTYLNISERKQAEEERSRRHRAEAESRAKSDFLARMSHEIRTPMNAVLGYAQLLARESGLTPRQREYLKTIDLSGGHLLTLISQVLDLARLDAGQLPLIEVEVDLRDLLLDLERMFRLGAAERGLTLRFTTSPDLPGKLRVDAGKVRQVLINLLGNSLKFTDRGSIELRLDVAHPADRRVRLTLEVQDSGCGIDAAQLNTIFEVFGQGEAGAKKAGAGLGLAVGRQLARQLGGDLTVLRSTPAGSVFRFDFVAHILDQQPARQEAQVLGLARGSAPQRCLVVDPVTDSRAMLVRTLGAVGFELREAEGLEQARVSVQAERPDVVLFDLGAPSGDGLEHFGLLRQEPALAGVPMLLIGTTAPEESNAGGATPLLEGFLLKPLRENALLLELGRVLDLDYEWAGATLAGDSNRNPLAQPSCNLPEELREGLRLAMESGLQDSIEAGIASIQEIDPRQGAELRALANDYDYAGLLRRLGSR